MTSVPAITKHPMLLTSAQIVSKYCLPAYCGELPHITQCIDAFLDVFSPSWNFAEIFTKFGSLHLMQYVASKELLHPLDPCYRRYLFNQTTWLAAERGDFDSIRWLVEKYLPQEFLTRAVNGAAAGGHVQVLQYLFDNCYERALWGGIEMWRAVTNEHSEAIDWLKKNAPPKQESLKEIMRAAGKAGNTDIIWWLYEENFVDAEEALGIAQMESKWGAAKWIFENCEMEDPTVNWSAAARCGELEILKYVYDLEIGCPNKDAMHAAAAGGHLDVLEWLRCVVDMPLRSEAARKAAENGHLEVVQWFKEKSCPGWEVGIMRAAATGGHLDILKWLRANCNDECNASVMYNACRSGSLDVVQWLNDYITWEDPSGFAMYTAARSGHLEIIKWLHANRNEGSTATMDRAARSGHLEVIKWLHRNRTEGCSIQAMDWAATNGHLDVVQWLHANRSEGCTTRAMDKAAENGYIAVVKWLHYNRNEGCTSDAMTKAIWNGHFETVLFLDEHRPESFNSEAFALFTIDEPQLELTQWLVTNYPERIDGFTFMVPKWDSHFNDWCGKVNFQRPQGEPTTWVCNSAMLHLPTGSVEQ